MFALTFDQQDIPPMAQKLSKSNSAQITGNTIAASEDLLILL
jgi:hypothetical protein